MGQGSFLPCVQFLTLNSLLKQVMCLAVLQKVRVTIGPHNPTIRYITKRNKNLCPHEIKHVTSQHHYTWQCKQPKDPLTHTWLVYHTTECYLAIRKSEVLTCYTWTISDNIIQQVLKWLFVQHRFTVTLMLTLAFTNWTVVDVAWLQVTEPKEDSEDSLFSMKPVMKSHIMYDSIQWDAQDNQICRHKGQ